MIYNNNTKVTPNKVVGCHFLRQSLLLLVLFIPMLVLTACDDAGSDSDTGPAPAVQFTATATNTTTTRSPNAAYQYVTFDIKSDVEVNVKLVLKEQGQPAPTRQEVLDGAGIYRALKTENKSLLLMYDINSKIKEYREALKASGRNMNIIHDATATALTVNNTGDVDTQNVDALLLKQNTTYTLYALQSDGPDTTEVQTLIDLTTREFDSANLPVANNPLRIDLGPSAPNIPFDATSGKGVESTNTELILYDSRDAAFIIPFAFMNMTGWARLSGRILKSEVEVVETVIFELVSADDYFFVGNTNTPISLMFPSFSSTNGTVLATHNNVKYHYLYGLIYDYNSDGYIFKIDFTYLSAKIVSVGYELQQDQ